MSGHPPTFGINDAIPTAAGSFAVSRSPRGVTYLVCCGNRGGNWDFRNSSHRMSSPPGAQSSLAFCRQVSAAAAAGWMRLTTQRSPLLIPRSHFIVSEGDRLSLPAREVREGLMLRQPVAEGATRICRSDATADVVAPLITWPCDVIGRSRGISSSAVRPAMSAMARRWEVGRTTTGPYVSKRARR
jgi:hypothetical protein